MRFFNNRILKLFLLIHSLLNSRLKILLYNYYIIMFLETNTLYFVYNIMACATISQPKTLNMLLSSGLAFLKAEEPLAGATACGICSRSNFPGAIVTVSSVSTAPQYFPPLPLLPLTLKGSHVFKNSTFSLQAASELQFEV